MLTSKQKAALKAFYLSMDKTNKAFVDLCLKLEHPEPSKEKKSSKSEVKETPEPKKLAVKKVSTKSTPATPKPKKVKVKPDIDKDEFPKGPGPFEE